MLTAQNVLIALAMLVGTVGIVVPVLPGLFIVWAASLVWALERQSGTGWAILAVTTIAYALGVALQYLLPGRRLRRAGIATRHMALALGAAVVGFFVIPVLGAPVFFVGAIYLLEHTIHRDAARARAATVQALRAVLTNIGIELATAFTIMTVWLVGVFLTRA